MDSAVGDSAMDSALVDPAVTVGAQVAALLSGEKLCTHTSYTGWSNSFTD
jgi:hypothetical protein